MPSIAPLNLQTPITEDPQGRLGFATRYLVQWLLSLTTLLTNSLSVLATYQLPVASQAASLVTTTVQQAQSAGRYRVTYYARITQAASSSSSLTITLGWLESGVALTQAFAAIVGNTTGTVQTGSVLVEADALSNLTVATTYASVGGTPMHYRLTVTVEQVS